LCWSRRCVGGHEEHEYMGMAMVPTTRGNNADTRNRRIMRNFLTRSIHRTEQNARLQPAQERPQSVLMEERPDLRAPILYTHPIQKSGNIASALLSRRCSRFRSRARRGHVLLTDSCQAARCLVKLAPRTGPPTQCEIPVVSSFRNLQHDSVDNLLTNSQGTSLPYC